MKRLFVIGDSISVHYGPYLRDMLRGRFEYDRKGGSEATLKDQFHADGANGGDSSMVLAYLRERKKLLPIVADFIAINCGLHDIKRQPPDHPYQVPIDAYRGNLRAILDEVRQTGAKMVWIRITPVNDEQHNSRSTQFHRFAADVEAYNAAADEIMKAAGVPAIDLFGFTRSLGDNVFSDHVHYPDEIRRLQAAYLAGALQNYPA